MERAPLLSDERLRAITLWLDELKACEATTVDWYARAKELEALAASLRTPTPEVLRAALVDWHAAMTASIAADEAVNGGDGPYDLLMLRAVNAARDADKASKSLMDTLAVVLAEWVAGGGR